MNGQNERRRSGKIRGARGDPNPRPPAALQGIDRAERVIYVGTLTKAMFPGLRLGYLVVPSALAEAFTVARGLSDGYPPSTTQAALADERLPTLPDVPTASELGYDVEWIVWRGFYAPDGMSSEAYEFWVAALQQLEASREWRKIRDESGLLPLGLFGEEFERFVDEQVGSFAELSETIGVGD